uniref:Uncharacterized protein n=1 Tax=Strigamia maritima TaxID=126957 RepID=T1IPW8_STRMM
MHANEVPAGLDMREQKPNCTANKTGSKTRIGNNTHLGANGAGRANRDTVVIFICWVWSGQWKNLAPTQENDATDLKILAPVIGVDEAQIAHPIPDTARQVQKWVVGKTSGRQG